MREAYINIARAKEKGFAVGVAVNLLALMARI